MAMVKKSITVTEEQDAWIQSQMKSGHYATDSEVVREAIREKQMRHSEIEKIRAALIHAEGRGLSTLTKEDIRRQVLAEMKRDGEL